jgi:hypothetical protein
LWLRRCFACIAGRQGLGILRGKVVRRRRTLCEGQRLPEPQTECRRPGDGPQQRKNRRLEAYATSRRPCRSCARGCNWVLPA